MEANATKLSDEKKHRICLWAIRRWIPQAYSSDQDDLAQDLFLSMERAIEAAEQTGGEVRSYEGLCRKKAQGLVIDHIRKNRTRHSFEREYARAEQKDFVERIALREELRFLLDSLKGKLRGIHLALLEAHFLEDLSIKECAEKFGRPASTVYRYRDEILSAAKELDRRGLVEKGTLAFLVAIISQTREAEAEEIQPFKFGETRKKLERAKRSEDHEEASKIRLEALRQMIVGLEEKALVNGSSYQYAVRLYVACRNYQERSDTLFGALFSYINAEVMARIGLSANQPVFVHEVLDTLSEALFHDSFYYDIVNAERRLLLCELRAEASRIGGNQTKRLGYLLAWHGHYFADYSNKKVREDYLEQYRSVRDQINILLGCHTELNLSDHYKADLLKYLYQDSF